MFCKYNQKFTLTQMCLESMQISFPLNTRNRLVLMMGTHLLSVKAAKAKREDTFQVRYIDCDNT